ncbi:MAG: class I SAM-dependent methyltransferase [Myxococcota bacterium]
MHLKYRQTCRACGCAALTPVLDLGAQHLQGSFVKEGKELPPLRRVPLKLVRCDVTRDENACGLLQLSHSTPTEILYSAYWYRSGTNRTMTDHLSGIATRASELLGRDEARVLDIGCNDGTLLAAYPDAYERFGVDPSDVAQEAAKRFNVVQDLFPSSQITRFADERPFDIITSIAMFYDLEDPVAFVRSVKACLAPQGLWVFEMSYMPTMLEKNSYDTICHEHLEYYSLAVLEFIAGRAGMKIIDAELNDINGGSIRCYATHADNFVHFEPSKSLAELRRKEFDLALDTDKPYRDFQDRIEAHRDALKALIKKLVGEGKKVHIYGASTKGNTILQFCGIDNTLIECAAERNPDKYGARTLGTDIPIVSEAESRAKGPDYYLVLPWHFKAEFVDREQAMLKKGVGMIFPLPEIEVVRK